MARYLRWDLSAFRPWEEDLIDAEDWIAAVAIQKAWRDGINEADEQAGELKR